MHKWELSLDHYVARMQRKKQRWDRIDLFVLRPNISLQ